MDSSLLFITLGQERVLCANHIWSVSTLRTRQTKAQYRQSKKNGMYIDWTRHHPVRTLIFLDNGYIIGTYFTAKTIYRKILEGLNQNVIKQATEAEAEEAEEDETEEAEEINAPFEEDEDDEIPYSPLDDCEAVFEESLIEEEEVKKEERKKKAKYENH